MVVINRQCTESGENWKKGNHRRCCNGGVKIVELSVSAWNNFSTPSPSTLLIWKIPCILFCLPLLEKLKGWPPSSFGFPQYWRDEKWRREAKNFRTFLCMPLYNKFNSKYFKNDLRMRCPQAPRPLHNLKTFFFSKFYARNQPKYRNQLLFITSLKCTVQHNIIFSYIAL